MEKCPIYRPEDLVKKESWTIPTSKKEDDFHKLQLQFEDSQNAEEKNKLLKELQLRIDCDFNLTILDAQNIPTKDIYNECLRLLNQMIRYGIDTTSAREKIDRAFSLQFLRERVFSEFRGYIKRLGEYSEKSSGNEHVFIFDRGYRLAKDSMSNLVSLGVPQTILEAELSPVIEKFLGLYLSDAITIAEWFLEGKSALRINLNGSNQVTDWRRDFDEALTLYTSYNGALSDGYKKILQRYRTILPKMLEIESNITIESIDSKLQEPPIKWSK